MSHSPLRLETPRPRPPPLPVRAYTPKISRSREENDAQRNDANTPNSGGRAASPSAIATSTVPSPRSRTRTRDPTPPPSARKRSSTPSQLVRSELEDFAEHCRAWYFDQNDNAGRLMTHTLATLPPSQRAPYARLQASIRSAYHASVNARRNAEFKAHLSATHPGGSLMPHSRADPDGPLAKKERYERFERFVRTWCTIGMPGTKPLFEGLWVVMRLQVVPEHLGGAGRFRIEWEIDDAVFKEAAGKEFMLEAIDILKGVLAFEESASNRRTPSLNGSASYSAFSPLFTIHSRSQSQPLPSDISAPTRALKVPPISSTTQTKRPRAASDPFTDTPALSSSYSSTATTARLSTSGSTLTDEPVTPTTPPIDVEEFFPTVTTRSEFCESDNYMRTWTAPDLPNSELLSLLSVFPTFITRTTLPRFPVSKAKRRLSDLEVNETADQFKRIRAGTGSMWVGSKPRRPNYRGGWWTRFKLWLQRIFC
ncbi:hypothetical protein WOLCODRAFT_138468 [Wolfiporia cocos MD-104 SS10]|uniref:Uncharacterized protein n=1 Tax=Wolfiporia cocos (strain MD-104) TaxID=742152 RepID=A0A2H3K5C1_WOLCO|nr:hypothetical protein WOLCODRAFT_138468 [Wolfiporia cocos MD-104 SS10]